MCQRHSLNLTCKKQMPKITEKVLVAHCADCKYKSVIYLGFFFYCGTAVKNSSIHLIVYLKLKKSRPEGVFARPTLVSGPYVSHPRSKAYCDDFMVILCTIVFD